MPLNSSKREILYFLEDLKMWIIRNDIRNGQQAAFDVVDI